MVKKAAQAQPNHLLRTARKERGWTQKDVADRIDAPSPLNITRWEGGTAFPSSHYIEKLCQLFGKSPRELGLIQDEDDSENAGSSSDAVPVASIDDATLHNSQLLTPSRPISHVRPLSKRLFFVGLGLLIVSVCATLLLYTPFVNWTTHRLHALTQPQSPADREATSVAEATATFTAANSNPYSPNGKLAFRDPLREPYLWRNDDESRTLGTTCQFTQGAYLVTTSTQKIAATCYNQDFDGKNVAFEVQMKISQGDCGGIIIRNVDPTDYVFLVCQDGYYSFTRYDDYLKTKVLLEKQSAAIVVGLNQVNVIAIVANGDTFNLYANKQKIDTLHDATYNHGQVGLTASNNLLSMTEIIYTNARAWTW